MNSPSQLRIALRPDPAADHPRPLRFPDGLGQLLERYDAACRREQQAAAAGDIMARAEAEAEKARVCDEYRWGARDLSAAFCLMLRHARQWNPTAVNDLISESVREVLREELLPALREAMRCQPTGLRRLLAEALREEFEEIADAVVRLEGRQWRS